MAEPAKDRKPALNWLLPAILLLYLAVVVAQSSLKLLWADELITFYIAQQPGWPGIWRALVAGADPNPPLIHILVQASTALFGTGALAIRLPAILCVLLAILSMWAILRRWVAPPYAAAGILAFMCTRGFDYSYDARSYPPLMGFAMIAFALWSALPKVKGYRQTLVLGALAVTLALGISSNYYGTLAFFSIAAGELVRIRQRRRLRFGVWLALLVGALPLVAYLPLIRHNIAEFAPHAFNRPSFTMVELSYFELVEGVFWPALLLGIYALWRRRNAWSMSKPETVALLIFLLYPFLGFAIAIFGAGMISPRCVVPVCCAFGLVIGLLSSSVFRTNPRTSRFLVGFFLVWFLVRQGFCSTQLLEQRRNFFALRDLVKVHPSSRILVADFCFELPLYFYADDATRRKIEVPIDFDAIHLYENEDSGEENLWAGRKTAFPMRINTPDALGDLQGDSLLIARPGGWLMHQFPAGTTFKVEQSNKWYRVGGVFTLMAHDDTRLIQATASRK